MANSDDMFRVRISGGGKRIEAVLPEQLQMSLQSTWEDPFKIDVPNWVNGVAQKFGFSTQFAHNSFLLWKESEPFQIALELKFVAVTDYQLDVGQPVTDLLSLAVPSAVGSNITIMGTTFDAAPLKPPVDSISVEVGNYFRLVNCVLVSAIPTFKNVLVTGGKPQSVEVSCQFRSRIPVTAGNIRSILKLNRT